MTEPNYIAEARKKVSRPQIREAFLRNGARIEPGRDDLPDWVYESVFELLEMAAPAVQGEPEYGSTPQYINDAIDNLAHANYELSYAGYQERTRDVELIRAYVARALQPSEQPPFEWPLLDAPAMIGGAIVGKGCSAGHVVAIAKRAYQYAVETSPEEHARREKAFKDVLRQIHEGIVQQPAPSPDYCDLECGAYGSYCKCRAEAPAEQQPACASQSVKSDSQAALSAESERQAPDVPGLTEALRQYQHNDGSGLVFGYDKLLVDQYVAGLVEALEGIMRVEARDRVMPVGAEWDAARAALTAYRKGAKE